MSKILIISDEYPPFLGGIARYAGEVALGLSRRDYEVHVLCNRRDLKSKQETDLARDREGVQIHFYDRPKSSIRGKAFLLLELPRIMRKLIQRLAVTQVIIVDPVNALSLPLTVRPAETNHSIVLHGSEIRRYASKWLTRRLMRSAIQSAEHLFTTTAFVDDELFDHFETRGVRTSCGVGRDFLESETDDSTIDHLRKRYAIGDEDFIAGTICRLDYRKGHDLVIKAIANLAASHPTLRYLIGGGGEERDRIDALTKELQIEDRVIMAGRIAEDELVSHYDLFDLFVMPNRLTSGTVEGFGISFVEAAARGVPSIGVDNGGVREAIADGLTGTLLPEATVKNVERALTDVLANDGKFSARHLQQHAGQFNWDRVVDQIAKTIDAR